MMSGKGDVIENDALARNFARLGIPVTKSEVDRVEGALRALTTPPTGTDVVGKRRNATQFDEAFDQHKERYNPKPQNEVENVLVQGDYSLAEVTSKAHDVQVRFGCFVEIFESPFGNVENGLLIAVKDVFYFGSHRPTAGVPGRSNHIDVPESPVIDRLVRAGASIIGTTKLPPWCYLPMEYNPAVVSPENPLGKDLLIGGSSSGSAVAVASGLVPAALGTDTGGSVRIPAALTGLYGFKPTIGRIQMEGVVPLGETQDTVGVLANDIEYVSKLFNAMKLDHVELNDPPLHIGRPVNGFDKSDNEIAQAADIVVASLLKMVNINDCSPLPLDEMNKNAGLITGFEAARLHQQGFIDNPEDYIGSVRERLLLGLSINEQVYRQQMDRRAALFDFVLQNVFGENSILMVPTLNCYAPTRSSCPVDDPQAITRMTLDLLSTNRWVNLLGLPAITIPVSLPEQTIPASIQFVGKPYCDEELIKLAVTLSR